MKVLLECFSFNSSPPRLDSLGAVYLETIIFRVDFDEFRFNELKLSSTFRVFLLNIQYIYNEWSLMGKFHLTV